MVKKKDKNKTKTILSFIINFIFFVIIVHQIGLILANPTSKNYASFFLFLVVIGILSIIPTKKNIIDKLLPINFKPTKIFIGILLCLFSPLYLYIFLTSFETLSLILFLISFLLGSFILFKKQILKYYILTKSKLKK